MHIWLHGALINQTKINKVKAMAWNFLKKNNETIKKHSFDVDELLNSMQKTAEGVGELTLEIVGISGRVDSLSQQVDNEAKMFNDLKDNATSMIQSNRTVNESVNMTKDVIVNAIDHIQESKVTINSSIHNIKELSESVTESSTELVKLSSALRQVKKITSTIASISKQTNLLALNATIEASRAGEAGRGFAVVADEVKSLSKKAGEATSEISVTVNALANQIESLVKMSEINNQKAESVKDDAQMIDNAINSLEHDINAIDENSSNIVHAAADIEQQCNITVNGLNDLTADVEEANVTFVKTKGRINALRNKIENIVRYTLVDGVETIDTPMINTCQQLAKDVTNLFEGAIENKQISESDLFDFNYTEIPGTNPVQYNTKFVEFCDKFLPGIQQPVLEGENKRIATCTATDINGFIPRHINARHNPQRPGDVAWNNLNCRSMRIYNDPSGMNAAKNRNKFILQTYRIPYLGGQFAVLKDCSSPVYVNGKHWGCIRITYDIQVTDEEGNDIMKTKAFQEVMKQDKYLKENADKVKLSK